VVPSPSSVDVSDKPIICFISTASNLPKAVAKSKRRRFYLNFCIIKAKPLPALWDSFVLEKQI
jgi:hypothetical protein